MGLQIIIIIIIIIIIWTLRQCEYTQVNYGARNVAPTQKYKPFVSPFQNVNYLGTKNNFVMDFDGAPNQG
jgi:hypothetical protein